MMHSMFMVVNRLNIVLIVKSMIQSMVSLVVFSVAIGVLSLILMTVVIIFQDAIPVTVCTSIRVIKCVMHAVLVIVNRLNIVLVIESVIQRVVSLVVNPVAIGVLVSTLTMHVMVMSIVAVRDLL